MLGEDHPDTLGSASNLTAALGESGRRKEALALAQDTLDRYRRVLGEDHPDTLASASNLDRRARQHGPAERGGARSLRTPMTGTAGCWAKTTPTP